jgi:glycosyltransferase involved in cell wall biosynthesis
VADFYASIDVLALPSINRLEAFGIVQAEALMLGIPVVASDLPGVRMPILEVGLGRLVRPRDSDAITDALTSRVPRPEERRQAASRARELWGAEPVLDRFAELLSSVADTPRTAPGGGLQSEMTAPADSKGGSNNARTS